MSEILKLCFLGKRTYLQGTTLFQAFADRLKGADNINFRCRKIIASDCVSVEEVDAPMPGCPASLSWKKGDKSFLLTIHEAPASKNPERQEYDESKLTKLAHIEGESIALDVESPFPFASTIVSLHKHLLLTIRPPEREGQWLFTGLQITSLPEVWLPLKITVKHFLAGMAARSEISIGGQILGQLEFVWYKQNMHKAS